MTILATCKISGIQFPVEFGVQSSRYLLPDSVDYVHPVFKLPLKTIYHLAEDSKQELLSTKDRGLLHLAVLNATGLISYQVPAALPTTLESNLYLDRTLTALHWLEFRGHSEDIPHFNVTRESRGNLVSGFLKELETFRENINTRRRANDIQQLASALDTKLSRRETYGLKLLTPMIADKVCELIQWGEVDIPIAKQYLLADPHSVLKMINDGDLHLADLANLMLDIEILDWAGRTRDTVLAHLRGLANILHTIMKFSQLEKDLFSDTIEPVSDFLDGMDFGTGLGASAKGGPKFRVVSPTEVLETYGATGLPEDIQNIKPLSIADRIRARGIKGI